MDRCLDAFEKNLNGFNSKASLYGFPFNSSNREIETYVNSKCRACRKGGDGVNPLPTKDLTVVHSAGGGPGNSDADMNERVDRWLAGSGGWLIYQAHALDEEGWGPLTEPAVRRLYDRLLKLDHVHIVTPTEALGPG